MLPNMSDLKDVIDGIDGSRIFASCMVSLMALNLLLTCAPTSVNRESSPSDGASESDRIRFNDSSEFVRRRVEWLESTLSSSWRLSDEKGEEMDSFFGKDLIAFCMLSRDESGPELARGLENPSFKKARRSADRDFVCFVELDRR